jgi:hypothetical protein
MYQNTYVPNVCRFSTIQLTQFVIRYVLMLWGKFNNWCYLACKVCVNRAFFFVGLTRTKWRKGQSVRCWRPAALQPNSPAVLTLPLTSLSLGLWSNTYAVADPTVWRRWNGWSWVGAKSRARFLPQSNTWTFAKTEQVQQCARGIHWKVILRQ